MKVNICTSSKIISALFGDNYSPMITFENYSDDDSFSVYVDGVEADLTNPEENAKVVNLVNKAKESVETMSGYMPFIGSSLFNDYYDDLNTVLSKVNAMLDKEAVETHSDTIEMSSTYKFACEYLNTITPEEEIGKNDYWNKVYLLDNFGQWILNK